MVVYPFPQVTASGALPAIPGPGAATQTGAAYREMVAELHILPSAANTAAIQVYDVATGIVLKDLLPPANGLTDCFFVKSGADEDAVDPTRFGITVSGSNKANVYAVIR